MQCFLLQFRSPNLSTRESDGQNYPRENTYICKPYYKHSAFLCQRFYEKICKVSTNFSVKRLYTNFDDFSRGNLYQFNCRYLIFMVKPIRLCAHVRHFDKTKRAKLYYSLFFFSSFSFFSTLGSASFLERFSLPRLS